MLGLQFFSLEIPNKNAFGSAGNWDATLCVNGSAGNSQYCAGETFAHLAECAQKIRVVLRRGHATCRQPNEFALFGRKTHLGSNARALRGIGSELRNIDPIRNDH